MKLIDLLYVCNENADITVVDPQDNILTQYDGINSIDEEYNNREVIQVTPVIKADCVAELEIVVEESSC